MANAVSLIAHSANVAPSSGRIQHGLTRLAGNRPGATLRDDGHVAAVEVDAKRRHYVAARTRAISRQRIGLAMGIDKESAIFLNDPAIVESVRSTQRLLRAAINQVHNQTARRGEVDGRRIA